MRPRLVSIELWRQRRRVRQAERTVQRDRAAMSRARDRVLRDIVATPVGIAGAAAIGFCFHRMRVGRRDDRGALGRFGSLLSFALWLRRVLAPAMPQLPPTD